VGAPVSPRSWNRAWLVIALIVVGLAVAREARTFGLFGILGPVIAVVAVLLIVRAVAPNWLRPSRPSDRPPVPRDVVRDVTPREPAVTPGSTISSRPTPAQVVVIEPAADAGETLETKLATLDRLRQDGRLTDVEYEAKRAQLIADF
jgi:hypothetical protein